MNRRLPLAIGATALLTAACGAAVPGTDALPGPKLDRTALTLTFEERFEAPPSFYDPAKAPRGRWKTNYAFSFQDPEQPRAWEARTLRPDNELEYYGNPLRGADPFEWRRGELTIVARPNPLRAAPAMNGLPYLSGLITTQTSFTQRYGYFEARVKMPVGKGLWPAFWLLPEAHYAANGFQVPTGQQEIDVFENIGDRDKVYLTAHHDEAGRKVGDGGTAPVDRVDAWHDYGVLWTRDAVAWYIDGREVRHRPNVDFHMPAYMLLNLAVGGDWPGRPDVTTPFPARMRIAWVRAYALKLDHRAPAP